MLLLLFFFHFPSLRGVNAARHSLCCERSVPGCERGDDTIRPEISIKSAINSTKGGLKTDDYQKICGLKGIREDLPARDPALKGFACRGDVVMRSRRYGFGRRERAAGSCLLVLWGYSAARPRPYICYDFTTTRRTARVLRSCSSPADRPDQTFRRYGTGDALIRRIRLLSPNISASSPLLISRPSPPPPFLRIQPPW